MKNCLKIIFLLFALNLSADYSQALDIIYPQQKIHKTSSDVTYIMGNVSPSSTLTINGERIKVWYNGAFCKTVKLKEGDNVFKITENTGSNEYSEKYKVVVPSKSNTSPNKKNIPEIEIFKNLKYAKVTNDGAPVRKSYSDNADRITHLPKNTVLIIDGKYKDWYRISSGDNSDVYWFYSKNTDILYELNSRPLSAVKNASVSKNRTFSEIRTKLEYPVMFKTKEENNNIYLTLYGIKDISPLEKALSKQKIFKGLKITENKNNNVTLLIPSDNPLWGYQADYDGNTFVFRRKNTPHFNKKHPLKNITVTVDPGHGGKELGAVGPTRIPEKDINLAISKELKKHLEKEGAKVILTRDDDSFVGLYERPEIANKHNSLICLSIHANSLVDKDPYEKHGVSTFYYHPQAKELAHQIKLQMIKDLKLKDDLHRNASFVLTRPTMPLSVLVEVAYMPNPEEYIMLNNPLFQERAAKSICEGVKNYIKNTMPKNN